MGGGCRYARPHRHALCSLRRPFLGLGFLAVTLTGVSPFLASFRVDVNECCVFRRFSVFSRNFVISRYFPNRKIPNFRENSEKKTEKHSSLRSRPLVPRLCVGLLGSTGVHDFFFRRFCFFMPNPDTHQKSIEYISHIWHIIYRSCTDHVQIIPTSWSRS